MRVIESHFEGKDTIIVGNYVNNGCQTFDYANIVERKRVLAVYGVTEQEQAILAETFKENKQLGEDWEQLYEDHKAVCYGTNDYPVQLMMLLQGKRTDLLKDSVFSSIRENVALRGFHLEYLKGDPESYVRTAVASATGAYDEEFKSDPAAIVRKEVAKRGKYLPEFVNDESWLVRRTAYQAYDKNMPEDVLRSRLAVESHGSARHILVRIYSERHSHHD